MRNNAPTILIVEDDERIRSLMRTVLAGAGYATLETGNAATAVSMLASHSPDLMVLDLGLPDRDGQELLSEIRAWSSVPVVVVSARGQEKDKVYALDGGADDYITKPFGTEELLARIRAALRHGQRMAEGEKSVYTIGGLQVDTEKRIVRVDGKEVHLTQIEYKIRHAAVPQRRQGAHPRQHDPRSVGPVLRLRHAASARQHGQHPPQDRKRPRHAGIHPHRDRRGVPPGRGLNGPRKNAPPARAMKPGRAARVLGAACPRNRKAGLRSGTLPWARAAAGCGAADEGSLPSRRQGRGAPRFFIYMYMGGFAVAAYRPPER